MSEYIVYATTATVGKCNCKNAWWLARPDTTLHNEMMDVGSWCCCRFCRLRSTEEVKRQRRKQRKNNSIISFVVEKLLDDAKIVIKARPATIKCSSSHTISLAAFVLSLSLFLLCRNVTVTNGISCDLVQLDEKKCSALSLSSYFHSFYSDCSGQPPVAPAIWKKNRNKKKSKPREKLCNSRTSWRPAPVAATTAFATAANGTPMT